MLSYQLLDHSIYCLPRVRNILDWTLRGGDALTRVLSGNQSYKRIVL
jgi:hypothetical protein